MSVITANNLSTIDARLRHMFFEASGNIPIISTDIVKTETTERAYEIFNRWSGTGEAPIVGEGANYTEKDIAQETTKTVSVLKFGFKIRVTRELIKDNLFEPIQDDVAKAMKNSMVSTKERRQMNLLNNGFTTQLTPDGLSLFNSAHTLVNGGTQSNVSAASTALDIDFLWEGVNTMQTTVGNSGLYDNIYPPKWLVVPQALERRANELLRSDWVPQSTENQDNVVKFLYPIKVRTTPFLTSTTAWFLFGDKSAVIDYGLVLLQREPLEILAQFDEKAMAEVGDSLSKDIYAWKCRERYEAATPTHFFGTFGNAGA